MIDPTIDKIMDEAAEEFNINKSLVISFVKYFFNWQFNAINAKYAVSYLWSNMLTITMFNKKNDTVYFEAVDEYLLNNRKSANKTPTKGWSTNNNQ
jgi:hypothetical protein|tara:strand:- start:559 stop:846 length:288 start_codon:yes stop_codon:yes gene_type:complete